MRLDTRTTGAVRGSSTGGLDSHSLGRCLSAWRTSHIYLLIRGVMQLHSTRGPTAVSSGHRLDSRTICLCHSLFLRLG